MRDKTFVPREYDVFAGLDVDKKSIAATFSSHQGFIRSLSMPKGTAVIFKASPQLGQCSMPTSIFLELTRYWNRIQIGTAN